MQMISMRINDCTLERLSRLELKRYAGDLRALSGEDLRLYKELMISPVQVKVIIERGICEDAIYEICVKAEGEYNKFKDLRHKIIRELSRNAQAPGWDLLSVLSDGIYVGEMEDLLNYRYGNQTGILYPTKGLGEKIAQVIFINKLNISS